MVNPVPMNCGQFIEQQLSQRVHELEKLQKSHVIFMNGPIVWGVDDFIRTVAEQRKKQDRKMERLTMLVTTVGGYVEIVQRIVDTLRYHYKVVDFIVPNYAFSVGTVLVLSGDDIYMDYYSRLGPIDPQVQMPDGKLVPALGYIKRWEELVKRSESNDITLAEIQVMVDGFDQAELYQYDQAKKLSISLIKDWLVRYKFKNWTQTESRGIVVTPRMRKSRAEKIAKALSDTDRWHTHGSGISMDVLSSELKLLIKDFAATPHLNEEIRSYQGLLDDYMEKNQHGGVIHSLDFYQPYTPYAPSDQ